MEQSKHGGNLYDIARRYGIKEEELLDFSASINPLGLSKLLKDILHESVDRLVNYPDPECSELEEGLSTYAGIPRECVIAGNGASEMIYLLLDVLRPRRILMPAPCFTEYARAAEICGAAVGYYELKEENGFKLDMPDFIGHIRSGTDAVLLCNPNNPTSVLVSKEDILALLEYASRNDVKVIIDEAFIELTLKGNRNSAAYHLSKYRNLFILRSLTKILAIPGLRLGYTLGDPQTASRMRERKIPWSVNAFACAVGRVLTGDPEYFEATALWLKEEMEWLYGELSTFPQLKVFRPDTNFVLIKLLDPGMDSALLREALIRHGILIRDAGNFRFLDDRFIRVAVRERKSNQRLVDALHKVLAPIITK